MNTRAFASCFELATAAGAFADAELPNVKWYPVVVNTKAVLVHSSGTAVIFR